MKKYVLGLFLVSQFSWGLAPGSTMLTLKCDSAPSHIGDVFEYEFKIEVKTAGNAELRDGSKMLLKPLNINQSIQSAWQKITVQEDKIEMSSTQYNRLLEHTITQRFILDRKTGDFTLARTTQDISKPQTVNSGLVQLQSGSCTEK